MNQPTGDSKGNTSFPIRTITLRSSNTGEVRKEGTSKRLPDAKFQMRREKELYFRCNEKYSADHKYKMKEQRDLRMMVEVRDDTAAYVELSINSVVGLNDPGTMKWLYSRGVTVVDWRNLTLTFHDNERQVCIKGDPSLTKSRAISLCIPPKEEMEKLVGEMLASGVIRPSVSPYSSLVLLVKKKDETFQSSMNTIFKPYLRRFVLIFFDDILVYSKNIEDHLKHMEAVLAVLRRHELYANRKKCSFGKARVEYLGHIISENGGEVDPEKIRSIADWPKPTNLRETRGFLGLTEYYRRFVHQYGAIAAPLTMLLKKGGFKWSKEADEAFDKLKEAMMSLPILALPNFDQSFKIEMDAPGFGIEAVLIQAKWPIAFYSHTLAMRDRVIQPQYQRWIAELLGYSFEVVYKPGVENKAADALSRMPPTAQLCSITAPVLLDLKTIKEEVEKDVKLQKVIAELSVEQEQNDSKFKIHNGMLRYKNHW
ncbi:Transposon Tf2-9 polyprotein [Cucumis melo var. makuwa]|uniref:Transposon Tf2-9 polyprotein n=1 Tax=Cucumis melo var. makuwa TaxID=1194695 RepID=A0A5A7TSP5_CUCMM|nr:Transposon Tf2-9 polyprotein [Cucumis melo var. makuwa]